jgi:hypothetical protein
MPSLGASYRLTSPTIGLFSEEGRQVARMIPLGSVIKVTSTEGNRLTEVEWNGQTVLMFPQDIRARGEKLDVRQV